MWGTYNAFGLSLALLEGVFVLELGSHVESRWVICRKLFARCLCIWL